MDALIFGIPAEKPTERKTERERASARPSEQGRGLRGQQTSRRRVRTARFHLFAAARQVYGMDNRATSRGFNYSCTHLIPL